MDRQVYMFAFAALALLLVPIVPKLIDLRVRVLRAVHLDRVADWHERHTNVLVPVLRAILTALAVVLVVLGLR